MASSDARIRVHANWRDWRTAEIRLADLHEVQWLHTAGAPHPLLHGYVDCSDIRSGQIPHVCDSSSAPHRLLVCVIRRNVLAAHYEELVHRADARRQSTRPASATAGATSMMTALTERLNATAKTAGRVPERAR